MIKLGIFGNPVEHSKSPQMQNSALKSLDLDGEYDRYLLLDGSKIKEEFLNLKLNGANITIPHKEEAYKNADEVRGIASKIGAVNTYVKENDKIIGYNTDAPGFMKSIEEYGEITHVCILGAGGTARALALAFLENGTDVTIINRTRVGRLEFFEDLGCKCYSLEELYLMPTSKYPSCELIVNTTSAGLNDNFLPIPIVILKQIMKQATYAVDCIYGKVTPFLNIAKDLNLTYKDGKDMLLFQGVLALELFLSKELPQFTIEQMNKCLE
ncbi:MAG: shikimate dehydrogenase [Arcobacter butzleri]|nr:shikimate dehydrogenase [Aliarcobacter butzleri]